MQEKRWIMSTSNLIRKCHISLYNPCLVLLYCCMISPGSGNWSMKIVLVLTLCIAEFVRKRSWLFTTKLININVYSHGRGKISNLMDRFLLEFLDLTPVISLTVLFCKVNIILLLGELPKKLSHISLWNGNRHIKLIFGCQCSWYETSI
jgi:hypothetical protein